MGNTVAPGGLFQYGGVPVPFGDTPSFGKVWFVDGTNGSAGGSGYTTNDSASTVALGIAAQIAETASLGDIIYIMPGTYAETVTGNLTKVKVFGTTGGGIANAVSIRPTDGSAYTGDMNEAAFHGIEFHTASTSNLAYGALAVTLDDSVIDGCRFLGATDTNYTVGLRIGDETPATWEHLNGSRVSNCLFSSTGNRTFELKVGICFGQVEVGTHAAYRQFVDSQIAYNRFYVHTTGILLQCSAGNCGGGLIIGNDFGSHQSAGCCNKGISAGENSLSLCRAVGNTISSQADAIEGIAAHNCMGNIVSANQAVPDTEYFDGS